jgi:hypothetical protein
MGKELGAMKHQRDGDSPVEKTPMCLASFSTCATMAAMRCSTSAPMGLPIASVVTSASS